MSISPPRRGPRLAPNWFSWDWTSQSGCSARKASATSRTNTAGGGADEPDPQCPADAAGGGHRPVDGVVDLLVGGPQLLAEAATDRGQLHAAAGALEQRRADAPFQLLDRLADPGRGHVQPLGRPAEVQLVGEGQEDLDVPLLHRRSTAAPLVREPLG